MPACTRDLRLFWCGLPDSDPDAQFGDKFPESSPKDILDWNRGEKRGAGLREDASLESFGRTRLFPVPFSGLFIMRFRLAMSTGSLVSASPLTVSTSTMSNWLMRRSKESLTSS